MTDSHRAPDAARLKAMAEDILAELPGWVVARLGGVAVLVDDFPDEETEAEMELETPFDLLGLYRGVPIGEKDSHHQPLQPDAIHLYRRPILDYWCETGEDLEHIVRHVLIHEIGHHMGFSDDDMDAIEGADEP